MLSGDVEQNPGPNSDNVVAQGYESSLVEGLAKLCQQAPSEKVRSVLGVWNPNKPGNEIRAVWEQGRRFLVPDLKGTLAWLTMTRECDVKGTKHEVAEQLLIALESLLPDTCQVCKEVYTVDRADTPSLRCKGCSQGFHQACFDRLEIGPSLAELPGEFSWLCTVCAPLYQLKTAVGGSKGQERPRLTIRRPPSLPQTQLEEAEGDVGDVTPNVGSASDVNVEQGVGEHGGVEPPVHAQPLPPTAPPLPPEQGAANSDAGQVCALYLSVECPHGISGKTGGICSSRHPKRCLPYMRWGNKHGQGCSGTTCGKSHPSLCPKSLDLRCMDDLCPWKLHTFRCYRPNREGLGESRRQRNGWDVPPGRDNQPQDRGHVNDQGQGRQRQRYPGQAGPQRNSNRGVGRGPGMNSNQASASNEQQYFTGMTAQPIMLGTFEKQLQQAVTRAIMQGMQTLSLNMARGQAPVWGGGAGGMDNANPSS